MRNRTRRTSLAVLAVLSLVCAAAAPAAATEKPGSGAAVRAALRDVVDAGAPGAVAVVDDGRHTVRIGEGLDRLEPPRAASVTDEFRVGSITKSFVATIALQLVAGHRLQLADTIESRLPGVVPGGGAITVRMLLQHRSGIPEYVDDPAFRDVALADPSRRWTPQELIAIALRHPALFPPGGGWAYSNTNYLLLGLILQRITGEPLERTVARRITGPLGLTHSYLAGTGTFRARHAHGYLPPAATGGARLDTSGWAPTWAWAAGAMVSTPADLARFYRALLGGRLLPPALVAELTDAVDARPGYGYGLGLIRFDSACGTAWGHIGGTPGYTSYAWTDRAGTRSAVVLVPTSDDAAVAAATDAASRTAVCAMFGRSPSDRDGSSEPPSPSRPPAG